MSIKNLLTPLYLDQWRDEYADIKMSNLSVNRAPHVAGPDVQHRVMPAYNAIADFVSRTMIAGDVPVTWNGDCCMAIPMLAGIQQAGIDPYLIWIDAHGDFNTWETTPSGFLGGMPLAMMVGLGEQTMMKGVDANVLPETDVVLTDARDLDPEEGALVAASKIKHLHRVGKLAGDEPLPQRPIWVHFDVDVMRIEDCPATNYPTPRGPTLQELTAVFNRIWETNQLCAVSVSLWEPNHPQAAESGQLVMQLVKTLTG